MLSHYLPGKSLTTLLFLLAMANTGFAKSLNVAEEAFTQPEAESVEPVSCTSQDYCAVSGVDGVAEWIASVIVGQLKNYSEGPENGYTSYTEDGPSTTFEMGATYAANLTPGFGDGSYPEGWSVFIDFNQDGDFEDEGENVLAIAPSESAVTGTFPIPANAQEGSTRMRIAMTWEGTPPACFSNEQLYGEVEDYCVTISPPAPCTSPRGLLQLDGNDSTTIVRWNYMDVIDYDFRYRLANTTDWIEVTQSSTMSYLVGLDSCSTYEAQVRSRCLSQNVSEYSESLFFNTACVSSVEDTEIGLERWTVAPNPVSQSATVHYNFATSPAKMGVRLFSQYGRELQYKEVTAANIGRVDLDMSNWPSGVYYLRLETEKGSSRVRKIIKL